MKFTDRQTELIEILSEGESQESAAERMGISLQTVKNHLFEMRRRADAKNTAALIALWLRDGKPIEVPVEITLGEWERLVDRVTALETMHSTHGHD